MEIKHYSVEKLLHRGTDEETPPPLIRARWLWILVDISFLKRLCDSCGERPGKAKYTSGIFLGNDIILGTKENALI